MLNSFLSWVDHDQQARNKTYQLLASYGDHDSRDELGIGAIRDSISDFLFPGTSTIQTRLKYMLIVPWIYTYLEKKYKRIRPDRFGREAEEIERSLIRPLIATDDSAGAFGKTAKDRIKRLPSSVYWNGLGIWSIRRVKLSQDQYHSQIASICRRLNEGQQAVSTADRQGDSLDDQSFSQLSTWDPNLPLAPDGFPNSLDGLGFQLTKEEAEYLKDCMSIKNSKDNPHHVGNSLLAELVNKPFDLNIASPWNLKNQSTLNEFLVEFLTHAEKFSFLIHGAALLYNLMVAEIVEKETDHRENDLAVKQSKDYEEKLKIWDGELSTYGLKEWDLNRFWELIRHPNHDVHNKTKEFVKDWLKYTLDRPSQIAKSNEARDLIRMRELRKGAKSRLHKKEPRDRWGGESGTNRLRYRWSNVVTLLKDLYKGLGYEL